MKNKIHPIDLEFHGNFLKIFCFLVETSEGPVVIETGPHSSNKKLVEGIEKVGYKESDIQHVLLTHVHLDHAGGAWCWAEKNAKIYVHPEGHRHIHDPTKLLSSAKRIYGPYMDFLWGTLKPISAELLQIVEDQEVITIGDCSFKAIHTPGHAKHHIAWQLDNVLFTGDVAAVWMDRKAILAPCPPPDINIEQWVDSIDKCLAIPEIDTYYLTHGSKLKDIQNHMTKLKSILRDQADFLKPYFDNNTPKEEIYKPFLRMVMGDLVKQGIEESKVKDYENANPSSANVNGIMRYWKKKSEGAFDVG